MEANPQPPEYFEPEEPLLRPVEQPEDWDEDDTDVLPAEEDDGEDVEWDGRLDNNLSGSDL